VRNLPQQLWHKCHSTEIAWFLLCVVAYLHTPQICGLFHGVKPKIHGMLSWTGKVRACPVRTKNNNKQTNKPSNNCLFFFSPHSGDRKKRKRKQTHAKSKAVAVVQVVGDGGENSYTAPGDVCEKGGEIFEEVADLKALLERRRQVG
jgi:hypothetical protein